MVAVGVACFVMALTVPATAPCPLRTDDGPRSTSTRSRLKVFCGRMTMFAGPSQIPSRSTVICDRVKPRIEKLDGAAGFCPTTTPGVVSTASLIRW